MKMKKETEDNKAERTFSELAIRKGYGVKKSTAQEKMEEYWDCKLISELKVDVKSHKNTSRHEGLLKGYWWIEWKNVNGKQGWIYGKATHIAFFYFNKIYIYNRKELKNAVKEIVDFKKMAFKASEAKNCIYIRADRKDKISMVEIAKLHKKISPVAIWDIEDLKKNKYEDRIIK